MLLRATPCGPAVTPACAPRRQRRRCAAAAARDDQAELDDAWRKGVPEAAELLARAKRLAADATRRELLESLGGAASGSGAAAPDELAREGVLRTWREAGAPAADAARLAAACFAAGGRLATPDGAAAKLSQLRRMMPGADVLALVARDERVLARTDASTVVANLTALAVALPGVDPVALAVAHPPLLWADELRDKLAVCLERLAHWSPRSDAALIIEAHPALVERVREYYADKDFHELPMELQNAMAVGGGGGGVHYKSWSGGEWDNNTD